MSWQEFWEQVWQAFRGQRPAAARSVVFALIALLTALIVLAVQQRAHLLELGIAPLAVLACFLALAVLTGGLVVSVLAHRSGRS